GKEYTVWLSVKDEADRMISALPRNGLAYYQLTYGPPAAEMLKHARETSNKDLLAEVMRRYLYTDAGLEATGLLGTYLLDRGDFVGSAQCFERLMAREGPNKLAPLTLF